MAMPLTHLTTKLHAFGRTQPEIVSILGDLLSSARNPSVATMQADGVVSVLIRSRSPGVTEAKREMQSTMHEVEQRLGPIVFGRDDQTMQESLVELLNDRGLTIVTAESCTGGLVGKMITDVPGASLVYRGGWITYSNQMKMDQLGVPRVVLNEHGAVSEPVARALAQGAIDHSDADLSVAITGIAGPDGATLDKPVGTVWIAVGSKATSNVVAISPSRIVVRDQPRKRSWVRTHSGRFAIQAVRFAVLGHALEELD